MSRDLCATQKSETTTTNIAPKGPFPANSRPGIYQLSVGRNICEGIGVQLSRWMAKSFTNLKWAPFLGRICLNPALGAHRCDMVHQNACTAWSCILIPSLMVLHTSKKSVWSLTCWLSARPITSSYHDGKQMQFCSLWTSWSFKDQISLNLKGCH